MSEINNPFSNAEAEKAILASALQDPKCAHAAARQTSDLFEDPKHKLIHAAIRELIQMKQGVDAVTVEAQLTKGDRLRDVTTDYILELSGLFYYESNLKKYLGILQECAQRRQLRDMGRKLYRMAETAESPEECKNWVTSSMAGMKVTSGERLISASEAVEATFDKLGEGKRAEDIIKTGIAGLDERLGGLHDGQMIVIGARPSIGKSILALTFCVQAAKQGKRVLLVSLEMTEVEITERIMANEADISLNKMTNGKMTPEDWTDFVQGMTRVREYKLWYCLDADTVEKVSRAAYQLKENGGIDMIAIDYIQLMETKGSKGQGRQEQIAEISRGLRKLSMELNVPVVVLSQLNRQSVSLTKDGKAAKREPVISDARDSGAIEQDANVFILMHNPMLAEMELKSEIETWNGLKRMGYQMIRLIIAKNRQGTCGRVEVGFDGDHMRYITLGEMKNGKKTLDA